MWQQYLVTYLKVRLISTWINAPQVDGEHP